MKNKNISSCVKKYILCILFVFFGPVLDIEKFDINCVRIELNVYCS